MLSNRKKAHAIVDLIRREVRSQTSHYISAKADLAKAEMGKEMQEREDERQGFIGSSWSQDPYNVDISKKRAASTYKELRDREEVLEYAVNVFIDMLPDEEKEEKE
jgi:hypothetical protein